MISDLGERHVERMKERLDAFDSGNLSLRVLIADLESLLGLLHDEADSAWVSELEAECNRLEFAYAASLNEQRDLSEQEIGEVREAIEQLRLMLTRY